MKTLTLLLSPEQADAHCRTLITQSRHAGQTLAALTALHSLISATAHSGQGVESALPDIKHILEHHIATARNNVMEDNLARLLAALGELNLGEVQGVHAALSRNGFHQTVLAAIQQLPERSLLAAATWAAEWFHTARMRAEAASPYPDALDLRGAGISPTRFAAMSELNIYLQEALSDITS